VNNKKVLFLIVLFFSSYWLFSGTQVILDQKDSAFLNIKEQQIIHQTLSFSHAQMDTLADFSLLKEIEGDLVLLNMSGNYSGNFFPSLEKISGDLVIIGNSQLENVSFPTLTKVGGDIQIRDNANLKEIQFLSLTTSGSLNISRQKLLSVIQLHVFKSSGNMFFKDLPDFSTFDFPELEILSSLTIVSCRALSIRAGSLRSVSGQVKLLNTEADIDFASLKSCGNLILRNVISGSFILPLTEDIKGDLDVTECSFTSVELPLLTNLGGNMFFRRNGVLTSVSLKSLQSLMGNLTVWENAELSSFNVSSKLSLGDNNKGSLRYLDNKNSLSERKPLLKSLRRSEWAGSLFNGRL